MGAQDGTHFDCQTPSRQVKGDGSKRSEPEVATFVDVRVDPSGQ